jgi:hypothetical protein
LDLPNNSYKPITNTAWVRARLCKLQKGCTRLAVTSDTIYQLLAHGRWFSPGTPASSATKIDRHDIAEILLKVALNTKNLKKINPNTSYISAGTYINKLSFIDSFRDLCACISNLLSQVYEIFFQMTISQK